MQCPKCGSSPKEVQYREPLTMWNCGTTCGGDTRFVIEGKDCLRNQLTAANAKLASHDALVEAAEVVLHELDYLRELWGDEAINRFCAEKLRTALAAAKE